MKRVKSKIFAFIFTSVFVFCLFASVALAGNAEYQRCPSGESCILGEFLYNDSYEPIADALCTLTSRDPAGDVFLNAEPMTAESDGWYSHTLDTTGETEGFYRSQMCCTSGADYLCLDKSFYIGASYLSSSEVAGAVWNAQTSSYNTDSTFGKNLQNPVLTSEAIWSYSQRTLSSFGSLISDVWNYSTRSLTTFGTLVSDIWGSVARTLTSPDLDTGQLATVTDLETSADSITADIKSASDYDLGDIIAYVDTLETKIGSPADTSAQDTVFGRVKGVKEEVDRINAIDTNIDDLLDKWGSYSATDIYDKVKNLSADISAVNSVSNVSSILTLSQANAVEMADLKNKAVAMKAVLDVNRILLDSVSNQPVIKTWLEEGSIIFKTLITNPSLVASQQVPLKYYLPREVSKEDIIKIDDGLTVAYDPAEESLLVSGEFELAPQETKIVSIETTDIWQINENELADLKNQAQELIKPLENTSYFSQGQLLKVDIDSSIARISRLKESSVTPQAKIRAYRDALIELEGVEQKLTALKTLVSSAGSAGTLFGSIAGIQTFGAWGIILVLIAGFVFLSLWFSGLIRKNNSGNKENILHEQELKTHSSGFFKSRAIMIFIGFWAGLIITGLTVSLFLRTFDFNNAKSDEENQPVMPTVFENSDSAEAELEDKQQIIEIESEKEVLGASRSANMVKVEVPDSTAVNLRLLPDFNAPIIAVFEQSIIAEKLAEQDDWVQIKLNPDENSQYNSAWIYKDFIYDE